MKKIAIILIVLFSLQSYAKTISGEVKKEGTNTNRIYDLNDNLPIDGALVRIPSKKYSTSTDKNGIFELETKIDSPTIMSIEKSGYKPYSMTISSTPKNPIIIGIEKTTPQDIIIETGIIHLGDNSFSENSANSSEFSIQAMGAFYSKDFTIRPINNSENIFLTIGSIIGIDTIQSQKIGQSKVRTSYSSPPEIFCNENKIGEIKINGDNQKINIPKALLIGKDIVNITIKTGRNLYKTSAIDYDDIEFTNLLLEIK